MWDVIVAGAGPAGAVAAFVLARNGHHVLLADRPGSCTPRTGEALPGAAVQLLRSLDLPAPCMGGPHTPIGGNFTSWGIDALLATDFVCEISGRGWRLDRQLFDRELRAAAIEKGVTFREAQVCDLQRDGAHWQVRFGDGAMETARWLLDATGRRAFVARRLGAKRLRYAPALVALYGMSSQMSHLQLDRTLIEAVPAGWWYAARLPAGAAIAGFHTDAREASRLKADPERWKQQLRSTRHISAALGDVEFASLARPVDAGSARLPEFAGEGWAACGDAAMSVDPISGQGIFFALLGGHLAGDAIMQALQEGGCQPVHTYSARMERTWKAYDARWRSIYRSERRWLDQPFWRAHQHGNCRETYASLKAG